MQETIGDGVILYGLGWLVIALAVLAVAVAVSLAIVAAVWTGGGPLGGVMAWLTAFIAKITGRAK